MVSVELESWRTLLERAIRIKELAPWTWMTEEMFFGIEDPDSGTIAYANVSGSFAERHAVIAYLGDFAFLSFLAACASPEPVDPHLVLEIRQIHLSFESRDALATEDRRILRALGLRFRGPGAWPCFRSVHPGHLPWFLEPEEVRLMTCVLEQTEQVATGVREDPRLLPRLDDGRYLLRRRLTGPVGETWVNETREFPDSCEIPIVVNLDEGLISHVRGLPQTNCTVEMDLAMLVDALIRGKGERPLFPYVLLVVDARSGATLAYDVLSPRPSLEGMWGDVVQATLGCFEDMGFVPGTIIVRSTLMEALACRVADVVGVEVLRSRSLPNLEAALCCVKELLRRVRR